MHPSAVEEEAGNQELLGQEIVRETGAILAGIRAYVGRSGLARDTAGIDAAARELFHDAFLTAMRKSAEFQWGRPVTPWVLGIAVKHLLNRLKKARREVPVTQLAPREGDTRRISEDEMLAMLCSPEAPQPGAGSWRETLSLVTTDDARLLRLHYVEELDYSALAAAEGISEGAARVRVCRARRRLREAYEASERIARGDL
jgi:RNA polymerase sigma-70 factor (ECF subfamily)